MNATSSKIISTHQLIRRRQFLRRSTMGLGSLALASLINPLTLEGKDLPLKANSTGLPDLPHFAPKTKGVIFLFQAGGPSQMDLFDYKPLLNKRNGEEIPASVRGDQRISGMTASQGKYPLTGSVFPFKQYGKSRYRR